MEKTEIQDINAIKTLEVLDYLISNTMPFLNDVVVIGYYDEENVKVMYELHKQLRAFDFNLKTKDSICESINILVSDSAEAIQDKLYNDFDTDYSDLVVTYKEFDLKIKEFTYDIRNFESLDILYQQVLSDIRD